MESSQKYCSIPLESLNAALVLLSRVSLTGAEAPNFMQLIQQLQLATLQAAPLQVITEPKVPSNP